MANRLYIGGLAVDTTVDEVTAFFQQAGTVQSASVVTDKSSGRSRGFGFVEMASHAEAQQAISELGGKTLGAQTIRVEEARAQSPGGEKSGDRSANHDRQRS